MGYNIKNNYFSLLILVIVFFIEQNHVESMAHYFQNSNSTAVFACDYNFDLNKILFREFSNYILDTMVSFSTYWVVHLVPYIKFLFVHFLHVFYIGFTTSFLTI